MWKSAQRIISTVLTVCLLFTICPARAFASEVEQEVPAPAAESSTPIITLKNYDGSATLTTIETTAGTVFTQGPFQLRLICWMPSVVDISLSDGP